MTNGKCPSDKLVLSSDKAATNSDPIQNITLTEKPTTISFDKETLLIVKSPHVEEFTRVFTAGSYVVGEVLKNLFMMENGKYVKCGNKWVIQADRTL